jgi:hypothetical protein
LAATTVAATAATTVSLCDLGFCSVGIDEGWEHCTLPRLNNITGGNNSYCTSFDPKNANHSCTQHDAGGAPMVNSLFGGRAGLKALVDYGHSRGVRMGWYVPEKKMNPLTLYCVHGILYENMLLTTLTWCILLFS